jgi:hypothetical protein
MDTKDIKVAMDKIEADFASEISQLFDALKIKLNNIQSPVQPTPPTQTQVEPASPIEQPQVNPNWKMPTWWDTFRQHGAIGVGKRIWRGTNPHDDNVWSRINKESFLPSLEDYLMIERESINLVNEFFQLNEAISPEIARILDAFKAQVIKVVKRTGFKIFKLGRLVKPVEQSPVEQPPVEQPTTNMPSEPIVAMPGRSPFVTASTEDPEEPKPEPEEPNIPLSNEPEQILKNYGLKAMQIRAIKSRGEDALSKAADFVTKAKSAQNEAEFAEAVLGETYKTLLKKGYSPQKWFKKDQLPHIEFVDHQDPDAEEALADICVALKRGDLFKIIVEPKEKGEVQKNMMSLMPGPGVFYKDKARVFDELKKALGSEKDAEVEQYLDNKISQRFPANSVVDKAQKESGRRSNYANRSKSLFDKFGEPNY